MKTLLFFLVVAFLLEITTAGFAQNPASGKEQVPATADKIGKKKESAPVNWATKSAILPAGKPQEQPQEGKNARFADPCTINPGLPQCH